MNTPTFVDLTPYGRPVRLSVTTGITLPIHLIKAAPKQPSARVHGALGSVRDATKELQARLVDQQRKRDLRPDDNEFDGAWAGLYGRIQAHTRVVANPRRDEAKKLLATVFPDGLEFLKAGFADEWLYAKTLLERMKADGHMPAVEALAGPIFLAWAKDATTKLGDGLGVGEGEGKSKVKKAAKVGPVLTAIAHAIANYGRIYAGEIDVDDVGALAGFRASMAPIDEHRRKQGKRSGGEGAVSDEDEGLFEGEGLPELIEAPLPELPPLVGS